MRKKVGTLQAIAIFALWVWFLGVWFLAFSWTPWSHNQVAWAEEEDVAAVHTHAKEEDAQQPTALRIPHTGGGNPWIGYDPRVVRNNNKAVKKLENILEELDKKESPKAPLNFSKSLEKEDLHALIQKDAYEAYKYLLRALEKENFDPSLYLNLGLAFELNGEWEKAFLAYEKAHKYSKESPKTDFLSLYNSARIRGHQGRVDEALHIYQKALEIIPQSIEVKTNIELLTSQPPPKPQGSQGSKNQKSQSDKGEKDHQQEPKDESEESQKEANKKEGPIQNGKETPRTFEGRELSEDDVRKILEEIKNQEQKIRAKESKPIKEKSRAKDW